MKVFSVALLISTYNWPKALELILQSLPLQTLMPDEILIADDGSDDDTRFIVQKYAKILPIPVRHSWQEDNGFRKSLILNKALKLSTSDYIIQIDGDILLHPSFIEDHVKNARKLSFIQGSRAMVSSQAAKKILEGSMQPINFFSAHISNRLNTIRIPLLSVLFKSYNTKSSRIKACNFSFWKSDFIQINGYDNRFTGWGWEDDEFAARLINAGIKKNRLKFSAICYHLAHPRYSRLEELRNKERFIETASKKHVYAQRGFRNV